MHQPRILNIVCCAIASLALAACGGASTIGGTLSGLGSGLSVVLQNNGADNLTLTSNGPFSFASAVVESGAYNVAVVTQPVGQTCTVSNGSGSLNIWGDPAHEITVNCTSTSSIGGTVSGLPAGTSVSLANGSATLSIAANGVYAFPGLLAAGTAYSVSVVTQPAGHTCTLSNASGTVVSGIMSVVDVICV
jgi:hypothetical protein